VCHNKLANSDVQERPFSFKIIKFSLGQQNMTVQWQTFNISVWSYQLLNPVTCTKFQDLPYTYDSNFDLCHTQEVSKLHTIECDNVKVHNEADLCAHRDTDKLHWHWYFICMLQDLTAHRKSVLTSTTCSVPTMYRMGRKTAVFVQTMHIFSHICIRPKAA
jgi:hypothetical protein